MQRKKVKYIEKKVEKWREEEGERRRIERERKIERGRER